MDKDRCVLCQQETEYDCDTPVDARENYVQGVGQLCSNCYGKAYAQTDKFHVIPQVAVCPHCQYGNRGQGEVVIMRCEHCGKHFERS